MYVLFLLKTLYPIWLVLLLPPNLPSPISCFCILLSLSWLSMSHFISISPMICLPMLLELHRMSKAMQIINHFNIFQGNYQYQQWTPIIQSPPPSPLPAVTRLEVTGGCLLEHWILDCHGIYTCKQTHTKTLTNKQIRYIVNTHIGILMLNPVPYGPPEMMLLSVFFVFFLVFGVVNWVW